MEKKQHLINLLFNYDIDIMCVNDLRVRSAHRKKNNIKLTLLLDKFQKAFSHIERHI